MRDIHLGRWAIIGLSMTVCVAFAPAGALAAGDGEPAPTITYNVVDNSLGDDLGSLIFVDDATEIGEFTLNEQFAQAEEDVNDPLEGLNRAIFGFNNFVYDFVLGPVSDVYTLLPIEIRNIVSNMLSNLRAPVVFVNDLLQGEVERGMTTLLRFGMNSTLGLGGMVDIAESAGYEAHDEDFGQTLAVWGAGEGFYLVLPILGPSNPRDAIGQYLVDPLYDPFTLYLDNTEQDDWIYARIGVTALDKFTEIRPELDQIRRTSVDYYAAIRSLYRQRRAAEISNGDLSDLPAIPDFDLGDDEFPLDPAISAPRQSDQLASAGMVVSVGTSSINELPAAEDQKLWQDPLGVRFAPAQGKVLISSGYYVMPPPKPWAPEIDAGGSF
ncbi:MAG: VacJ family lipoprotein [Rhodospirillales bacterium]